jgi:glycosyltransferase involved in cell wall biosynthesis
MKVLHNQKFTTPPYSRHAVYVLDKLPPSIKKLIKYVSAEGFLIGALLFYFSKYYDAVVTTGHRPAISFAFLNNLFHSKRIQIIKEFYIDEKSTSSRWKRIFFKRVFKNVRLIITNCTGEALYLKGWLRLPLSRFKFLPWPSNLSVEENDNCDAGYVFAVGRSFRDWKTFFDAIRGTSLKVVVVGAGNDLFELEIPQEVSLMCDISYRHYLELLKGASFVVVPLKETFRSIGIAAILEAMSLGKAVVTAKVSGTIDYIRSGKNGLFYEPGNASDLRSNILRLSNDLRFRRRLGKSGQTLVKKRFNVRRYSLAMYDTLKKICQET